MTHTDKKQMRALIAQRRQEYAPAARLDLSGPILRRLAAHPQFVAAHTVLLYHSLPDEVDTAAFVQYWSQRKLVLLPSVVNNEIELHRHAPEDPLVPGPFGVLESGGKLFTDYASIDLAVIPGVAFDESGGRLGRGKGFYDRLLARLAPHPIYKVGICFDFQIVDHVPMEAHDVPMDEII